MKKNKSFIDKSNVYLNYCSYTKFIYEELFHEKAKKIFLRASFLLNDRYKSLFFIGKIINSENILQILMKDV